MNQLCRLKVLLCDIFPPPLAHLTPIAIAEVNLVTVQLTEDLSVVRNPICPVKPVLK
jgi:hypothetical protein